MPKTKDELKELAKDLYKRLGGTKTKDGRIVLALIALIACFESSNFPRCPKCDDPLIEDDRVWECINEKCPNCRG